MRPLGIIVFGCLSKPKYKQQLEDIWNTWGKEAIQLGCILRFYVGAIPTDIAEDMRSICINVEQGDDYISATFKQWRGLEAMIDTEELCRFYYMCGSDTFLNIGNALAELKVFDSESQLYIGGGMGAEIVRGTEYTYFSGGAGFFLTYSACQAVLDKTQEFIWWWLQVGNEQIEFEENGVKGTKCILGASDLQLGILAKQVGLQWIQINPSKMIGVGLWNQEGINKDTLISCHPMPHDEMLAYDAYLRASGAFGACNQPLEE